MATRFYISSSASNDVSPAFDGGWTRNTDGQRGKLVTPADASGFGSVPFFGNTNPAANATCLCIQVHSEPLAAGVAFNTSTTISGVFRVYESATNDNINRMPIVVKIVSENGATVRATLLALGHQGPNTTEWATSLSTKILANAVALTSSYTTVDGDRLVIEIGGQINTGSAGSSVYGYLNVGCASGTDLALTEAVTSANNPWIEFSNTISYRGAGPTYNPACMMAVL